MEMLGWFLATVARHRNPSVPQFPVSAGGNESNMMTNNTIHILGRRYMYTESAPHTKRTSLPKIAMVRSEKSLHDATIALSEKLLEVTNYAPATRTARASRFTMHSLYEVVFDEIQPMPV